jgi:site-specific DNA-methyltransferase (adenine-specific)
MSKENYNMEIRRIDIKHLRPNTGQIEGLPSNPRQWTQTEIDRLAKSLKETPELFEMRPLLVYQHGDEYVILGGNLRFEGAKKNKDKDCPAIVIPMGTSIDKLKEIVLKDNSSFGEWDIHALSADWSDLPLDDWGVKAVWDEVTLDETSASTQAEEAQEDDFDEEKDTIECRCKPGDIWILGDHKLMCGSSIDVEDVKKLMGGASANLWLTDPPYNVNYEGATEEHLKIANDNMEDGEFRDFLVKAYKAANEVMSEGASFYIWHADSEGYNFRGAARDVDWKIRECLIWNKNAMVLGRQDYQWKHEPCLYGWKKGTHKWYSDRKQTTVIDFDKPVRNREHPTMKPVPLFAYLMQNSTKAGDIVLDSFGGSGTTLIAAEQLGRKARLMELDPHYCDVIIARWEKLTGKEAVRCEE